MRITVKPNTSPTQYHLSTIVNPFSFLTPEPTGGNPYGPTQMTYKNVGFSRGWKGGVDNSKLVR